MLPLRAFAWTLAMVLVAPAALGAPDASRALPPAEHKSLQDFADANKDCGEWSDGCAVCLRHADGSFACSLPGIACQPGVLACRASVPAQDKPAQDGPARDKPARDTGAH